MEVFIGVFLCYFLLVAPEGSCPGRGACLEELGLLWTACANAFFFYSSIGERKDFEVYSCDVSPDGSRLVTAAGGEMISIRTPFFHLSRAREDAVA